MLPKRENKQSKLKEIKIKIEEQRKRSQTTKNKRRDTKE